MPERAQGLLFLSLCCQRTKAGACRVGPERTLSMGASASTQSSKRKASDADVETTTADIFQLHDGTPRNLAQQVTRNQ